MAVDYIGDANAVKIIHHSSASLRAGSDTQGTEV